MAFSVRMHFGMMISGAGSIRCREYCNDRLCKICKIAMTGESSSMLRFVCISSVPLTLNHDFEDFNCINSRTFCLLMLFAFLTP